MAQGGVLEARSEAPAASGAERIVDVGHGMTICVRDEGDPSGPPVLLVAGLGQQLNVWPSAFLDALRDRGLRVVRFDNRDVGRSGRAACRAPSPAQMLTRRFRADQYTLGAMAADTLALLDVLGIERTHLVGMSMGGMIAQTVAARAPGRVLSLTSIMSTTGAPRIGRPALSTWARMARPPAGNREAAADGVVGMMRHVGSRGYPFAEEAVREMALEGWDRGGGSAADGVGRQLAAIFKSGDRTAEVARIEAPTLVIHGDRDPMVHPSGGDATAAAIPGARLRTFPGMGHDLPADLCVQLSEEIAAHVAAA
ncbi:MAG TPA: alpha/beta hydrolase [Solirubrobacterales bacterium]|jgi:pimeloyl-ACP methyl ester carboxylesterase|nr:alpha/beta hydrolase [Solirubrobacterales bacterium]